MNTRRLPQLPQKKEQDVFRFDDEDAIPIIE